MHLFNSSAISYFPVILSCWLPATNLHIVARSSISTMSMLILSHLVVRLAGSVPLMISTPILTDPKQVKKQCFHWDERGLVPDYLLSKDCHFLLLLFCSGQKPLKHITLFQLCVLPFLGVIKSRLSS